MTLKEMRQARAAKAQRGKAATAEFNTLSAKENRTAEEEARLTALDNECETLAAEVEDIDGQIAAEENKARRASLFAAPAPAALPAGQAARTGNEQDPSRTGGYAHIGEFAASVRNAALGNGFDQRLAALPSNSHQNGGSSGEGFLVPPAYSERIWELVFGEWSLLSAVSPEPTNSNVVNITKDESTPWGATGVQANWRAEGTKMDPSKAAQNNVMVQLHELYAFVIATDELLSDAPRLNSRLTNQAAAAIRWKASDSIMWGDGVGKPKGFMNSAAKVAVAKEAGQAANTIVAANVANMYARLLAGNLQNTFVMANTDTLPQLMQMVVGNNLLWTPPTSGFANAPGGFLLGRPIQHTEHSHTLGTEGDITFVDPSGYYAATKEGGGIDFASSMHLYFDHGAQAFRWTFRLGGQPIMSAPVQPARGNTTKSHFITLATRA